MTNIEKIYNKSEELMDRVRTLTYDLSTYNPGIERNDKKFLITLGVDAKALGTLFEDLGIEIIKIHEGRQRDEINTNS